MGYLNNSMTNTTSEQKPMRKVTIISGTSAKAPDPSEFAHPLSTTIKITQAINVMPGMVAIPIMPTIASSSGTITRKNISSTFCGYPKKRTAITSKLMAIMTPPPNTGMITPKL